MRANASACLCLCETTIYTAARPGNFFSWSNTCAGHATHAVLHHQMLGWRKMTENARVRLRKWKIGVLARTLVDLWSARSFTRPVINLDLL